MAVPEDGSITRLVTRSDIQNFYQTYLGRPVPDEGAITGRLGRTYEEVRSEIANSQEAQNRRAALAAMAGPQGPQGPSGGAGSGGGGGGGSSFPTITGTGDTILGGILNQLINAILPIKGISDEILAAVDAQIDSAFPALGKAIDSINKQLDDSIGTLIPNTLTLVGAALGGMETLLATFLSKAADIGDIGDMVADLIRENKLPMFDGLMDFVVGDEFNLAGEIGGKIANALFPGAGFFGDAIGIVAEWLPEPRQVEI